MEPGELQIGDVAPPIKLPDLDGTPVDLADCRRRDTLVLFWNPSCGFCVRMLGDLKRWEQERSADSPDLLVVSTGTVESNRAMALGSTVVLDQTFACGLAFRVRGTPAAVLVDSDGRIASGVANGAAAVFAVARSRGRVLA